MLWYVLEIQSCSPSSPMTLLTAVLLINPNNPLLLPTLLICFQFRCHIMLASSMLPLVKDHIFSVFHWYHSYAVCVSPIASHWMTFWPKAFFRNDSYQTPYIENSWFFTVKKKQLLCAGGRFHRCGAKGKHTTYNSRYLLARVHTE